jgi:drug/metabolite transporter (DMT)-like permease
MKKNMWFWLRESRVYMPSLLMVFVVNALVPALSRLGTTEGNLSFMQMAFWVNIFALMTLIPLELVTRKRRMHEYFKVKDIMKIFAFAFIWPFAFSFLYFGSVEMGSATLTSIVSRLSIFVYLFIKIWFYKENRKFDWKDLGLMICMLLSILLAFVDDLGYLSWNGLFYPTLMVIGVAIITGVYQSVREQWREQYDPLETILWLEIAMVVYSALLLSFLKHPFFPVEVWHEGRLMVIGALWKPAVIGIAANAFGFWASLQGQQNAASLNDVSHKVVFLVMITGMVTFVQMLVISVITSEVVTNYQWTAGLLLTIGLITYRLLKSKSEVK